MIVANNDEVKLMDMLDKWEYESMINKLSDN